MDEWLFWEQYSHEPYIAVCRFQMVYLGKPASDLDPDKVKRGYAALARMEQQLAATPFLVGDALSLADVSLLAYTRVAHEGGFHLDGYAAVRRWIGEAEAIARPAAGALRSFQEISMAAASSVTIRRARRDDVAHHRRDAGRRSARQRARADRGSAAGVLLQGVRDASIAIRTSSSWSPRRRAARWSAACSSASCRA